MQYNSSAGIPTIYQSEATTVIRRYNSIIVSSPQSAPVARSLAMCRDPLTGPIMNASFTV